MLLRALLESQFEVFAQQCAINVAHVIAHDVGIPSTCYHHGENNTTGPKWPRARVCAFNCLQDQTHSAKRYGFVMARVSGLEKKQALWHLRWFYGVMRKMFGKDRRRRKCRCVCPGWCGAASPWKPPSAANDLSHCVTFNWAVFAPQRASVAPSE